MYRLKKVGKKERRFLGVCGGISKYIDPELDPIIIRLLWTILTLFSPLMLLVYFALGLVLKKED
jgi:phage shock protein C